MTYFQLRDDKASVAVRSECGSVEPERGLPMRLFFHRWNTDFIMLEISPKGLNMRSRDRVLVLLIWTITLIAGCATPQAPAPSTPATAANPANPAAQVEGNLAQLMRGILFPASNVIFAAQDQNPADVKPAD